jgi:hypothetical protein
MQLVANATVEMLSDRHVVVGKTIRNWLGRFNEEPIEQAPAVLLNRAVQQRSKETTVATVRTVATAAN